MVNPVYQDYSSIRLILPTLRVEELKSIIRQINTSLLVSARLTGKKDELIHRIESYLQDAIRTNHAENYERIKSVIYGHCREPIVPSAFQRPATGTLPGQRVPTVSSTASNRASAPTIDFGSAPLARLNPHDRPQMNSDPVFGTTSTPASMIRPTAFRNSPHPTGAKNPIYSANNPPPSNPIPTFPPASHHTSLPLAFSTSNSFNQRSIPINFEKSPFYRIDSSVSMIAICHRAAQNDRKSVSLTLIITAEQRSKLTQSNQYQMRMFATSETFYTHPGYGANQASAPPALIEFPTTLDVKLNGCSITSNLKGIKKQPGTAPPPDLASVPGRGGTGQALDLREGKNNQLEIAYSNSDKRFFFIVYLVEYHGVYGLMKILKGAPKQTEAQVLQEIISSSGDDDVMASSSVVSLNDPVVFSRIKTPIRSLKCKHVQCFDAEMFYTMMEQTPTWLCPVCNVKLNNDEILIDEYFERILKAAPSTVESVIVESDGKWHDERYKCGTSEQKKPASMSVTSIESGASRPHTGDDHDRKKRKVTVLELESDDDIPLDRRPSHRKRGKPNSGLSADCVIDLTIDD